MSNIFYASKELLQSYNQYNRDNFNHGYSEKEFDDLDDTVMYPVSKVDKSKKDNNHRVYQFLLNDKGKFCVFYLNEDNSAKLQSVEIPNNLIN